jgi:CRISPR-associated protein Csb2
MTNLAITAEYQATVMFDCGDYPSPARLLAAMIGTCETHRMGDRAMDAIRSLEGVAPHIGYVDTASYGVIRTYVPINTKIGAKGSELSAPCGRNMSVMREMTTGDPSERYAVSYHYDVADEHLPALTDIAERLHFLGRGESLVVGRTDRPLPPRIKPDPKGRQIVSIATKGYCDRWLAAWERGVSTMDGRLDRRYGPVGIDRGTIEYTFKIDGGLGAEVTAAVCSGLRDAILSHVGDAAHPQLHGHEGEHIGIVALPNVGHRYAEGHIVGIGVHLPPGFDPEADRQLRMALIRIKQITVKVGRYSRTASVLPATDAKTLQPLTWNRASHVWATATPIVMDHVTRDKELKRKVAATFVRHGYPRPIEICVGDHCGLTGVASAGQTITHRSKNTRTHAIARFSDAVQGPVILGKESHFGLGLMRSIYV